MRVYIYILFIFLFYITNIHNTILSFAFNDGYAAHSAYADELLRFNMNATFYINTEYIAFKKGYLNVFDIQRLFDLGFEIGGHTKSHANLTALGSIASILEEICRDRARMIVNGWTPQSFSYPYNSYNAITQRIVSECGYNSALVVDTHKVLPLPLISSLFIPDGFTVDSIISIVRQHRNWTILNFHKLSLTSLTHFSTLLEWIRDNNIVVKSIEDVLHSRYLDIPDEFKNTLPTPTPDPKGMLKIYIGLSCFGIFFALIMYVVITTYLKRNKKYKFCC